MFRRFRIVVLLYILILVGGGAWLTRTDSTDWQEPLWVLVYPINADHSNAADTYIENLEREHFSAIEQFFRRQGQTYGLELDRPVTVRVAAPLFVSPTKPTTDRRYIQRDLVEPEATLLGLDHRTAANRTSRRYQSVRPLPRPEEIKILTTFFGTPKRIDWCGACLFCSPHV